MEQTLGQLVILLESGNPGQMEAAESLLKTLDSSFRANPNTANASQLAAELPRLRALVESAGSVYGALASAARVEQQGYGPSLGTQSVSCPSRIAVTA